MVETEVLCLGIRQKRQHQSYNQTTKVYLYHIEYDSIWKTCAVYETNGRFKDVSPGMARNGGGCCYFVDADQRGNENEIAEHDKGDGLGG